MDIKIEKTEWDLTLLLKEESEKFVEENKMDVEKAAYDVIKKWKNRTDYLESADSLKEALDDYERWAHFYGTAGKVGFYYWLKREKEQNNPDVNAGYNKLDDLNKKIANDMQFFILKLGGIKPEIQNKFLQESILGNYKHFLEKIFKNAKYMLSDSEEKILNLTKSNAYTKWVNMISGLIAKAEKEVISEEGKREKKNFESILKLTYSGNKKTRDFAAEKVNEILLENADVAETELNAVLSFKKMEDELRGFARADKSRHVADDIDSEIVDALVDSVTDKFDIAKRFYELKAKLLGLKRLEYHERNVEYGKIDKKYSYEESVRVIYDTFNSIDKSFGDIMKGFVEDGRVDVYPKKGKRGGAFCAHELISNPVYILLNHTDKLIDVTTFAHELGHGINNELIKRKQNALNFGTNLATAEVASTFMEDFVLKRILKEADDETRLAIMVMGIDDFVRTIIRQIALYNFEKELHNEFRKKSYLSKEEIGKIFQKNMDSYMGEFVEQSPGSENWWIHWWHIRECFYVYSYASGLLISKAMQKEVKKDADFIKKVKEFLSAGLSDSPRDIFLKLGIDITKKEFWNKGLDEIDALLKETEELAKKLGKI